MEIEIRAKLSSPTRIVKRLKNDTRIVLEGTKKEKDLYFKHQSDKERKLVLRIRRTATGDVLTFKAKSKGADTAWPDVDMPLGHAKTLESILRNSDYEEVVTITKDRTTFRCGSLEINVDHIKELGWFIEVEARGKQSGRKKLEKQISDFLVEIGISKDDIIRQGYVPLALAIKK
ncbi:MAG: Adenylyl cyclase CyaB [Parcubacteria group bacterium GW2011_GWA1_47_8]|nr:MAG: Adenylyl cyclase CyaB [Parcubacteria group bacterium GW2011_GWA1_47_8]